MTMHRLRGVALGAVAAAAFSATAIGAAQADEPWKTQGEPVDGCPYGAVCLYSPAGLANDDPEHVYWSYGVHELHNEIGVHHIHNNQSGGAGVSVWTEWSPLGHAFNVNPGTSVDANFTPYNFIFLYGG